MLPPLFFLFSKITLFFCLFVFYIFAAVYFETLIVGMNVAPAMTVKVIKPVALTCHFVNICIKTI